MGRLRPAALRRFELPAGTFDAQFTFAQVLMDAVSAIPGAMLAVTIPASDIEVGGSYGQEALERLQNITRRVGKPWKAATARESFEIVRRRLFEEVDASGLADIDAVARRFSALYARPARRVPRGLSRPRITRTTSVPRTRFTPSCSSGSTTTGQRWSASSGPAACWR